MTETLKLLKNVIIDLFLKSTRVFKLLFSELVFLESDYQARRSYKLEDFFWTGSGDGPSEEHEDKTSTIYETKIILSTVYVGTPSTEALNRTTKPITNCVLNCTPAFPPDGEINPTSVYNIDYDNSTDDDGLDADRQYWLLTVLKSDGKDPVLIDLRNSLAKLYRRAFQRQQERHLGIEKRAKRQAKNSEKTVKVYIHNVAKSPINGDKKIEVLYHVAVSGQPVPASTAAEDMRLVSDEEVIEEIGYPFLIKAEPYLKPSEPQSLASSKNTWLFIGSSLAILFILLLAVAFLSLCITKKKKKANLGTENRRQIFEHRSYQDKDAFIPDKNADRKQYKEFIGDESPTYINFRAQTSNETLRSVDISRLSQSSFASTTTSSSSLDISPLMRAKKQRSPPKKALRPKGATNKTVPLNISHYRTHMADSDTSSDGTRKTSPDGLLLDNMDGSVVSPKSYLSMPSVKSFPRGNIPESLNKVLEPVSVLHLDMLDDIIESQSNPNDRKVVLLRHGSMGTVEDPGVIGPVVWNMHRERLQHGVSVDEGIDDIKVGSNVARMRKRFHELLDDTFSLFGSRRDSPVDETRPTPSEIKSHSAVNRYFHVYLAAAVTVRYLKYCCCSRSSDDVQPSVKPRPKTSDPRRPPSLTHHTEQPRGAWDSKAPSPLIRPLSAGVLNRPVNPTPAIDALHINAEGSFAPNDPAVPLIAAIKNEIGKCSLPGSTTDLIGD
ncbi:hypothetical protein MML48_4g00001885 [Holotrichia oblita]|uniref:Uncharacterized protein n=1 Tax=Holotrichia oblita TaxID=644536 RepID=A0ACB9T7V9_HOLOL|nr:hypothetical protein MML48_4g00001885 [Holotrichia oblita]